MNRDSFNIQITNSAIERLYKIKEEELAPQIKLRIKIEGGGCSGFSYKYDFVEDIQDKDYVVEPRKNVFVVVDQLSQSFVNGATLNFVEELGSCYFEVKNPNASLRCGCGQSFSI